MDNLDLSIICPNVAIKIERTLSHKSAMPAPAYCEKLGENKGFKITLVEDVIEELYKQSWISKHISYDTFELGMLIHELAHLRYSKFDKMNKADNVILGYINNILEDSMVEYQLSLDFPEFSKYFTWLLSAVQPKLDVSGLPMGQSAKSLDKYLNELFQLTRFNIISPEADMDFINFCLPITLAAKRRDSMNVFHASELIFNWLCDQSDPEAQYEAQQLMHNSFGHIKEDPSFNPIGSKEAKEIQSGTSLGKSSLKDVRADIKTSNGIGTESIERKTADGTQFFLDTINKYRKQIENIHIMFKRAFTDLKIVRAFEGDINANRQQEAYLNSLIGEEGKDYQRSRKERVKLDVAILRDISGSTSSFKKSYAEMVVIILASLENIDGVRTTQIDFEGRAYTNKTFYDKLSQSKIEPNSLGGTNLMPALKELQKQKMTGKRNLIFIVSDGQVSDREGSEKILDFMKKGNVDVIKLAVGNYTASDYTTISVDKLPEQIAKTIVKYGIV